MEWVLDVLYGAISNLWTLVKIALPLIVVMQFMKEYKLMDKISRIFERPCRRIGLDAHAIYPLLSGLIFGLLYGSGLMLQEKKESNLPARQMTAVCLFLVLCHSAFEDHLLFWQIGASGGVLLLIRLVVAVPAMLLFLKLSASKDNLNKNENPRKIA